MFDSRTFIALAAAGVLLQAPVALGHVPPCDPLPDHSNYSGDHGLDSNGAWCPWDSQNFWKPQGVGCTTDAECQIGDDRRCVYTDTNGRDNEAINADIVVNNGIGYCDKDPDGGTECWCGIPPLQPHIGGTDTHPNIKPGQDPLSVCRDMTSKRHFPGVNIVAGCWFNMPDGSEEFQCMFQCNGDGNGCPDGEDPKAIRKMYSDNTDCPGYTSTPL